MTINILLRCVGTHGSYNFVTELIFNNDPESYLYETRSTDKKTFKSHYLQRAWEKFEEFLTDATITLLSKEHELRLKERKKSEEAFE